MCGIVGATAERNIEAILLEGLKRLEYRGYDSAGMAILDTDSHHIQRRRVHGKVAALETTLQQHPLSGHIGIAHTRWATHGKPSERNAHPHTSQDCIAVVHNGIIENYRQLRAELIDLKYTFESETDSEVIAHLIHTHFQQEKDKLTALHNTRKQLKGAYAIGILDQNDNDKLYAIRSGSPLVIGVGIGENFLASDPLALLPVTQKFIYLEEGDIAEISKTEIHIRNSDGVSVERPVHECNAEMDAATRGNFRHFMLKEIYDQPEVIAETLQCDFKNTNRVIKNIHRVHIVACGTSFHAGLVARYWLESIAKIPAQVEIASEYRYRNSVMEPDTLFIAISQSGETADTLAAVRHAKSLGCQHVLAICNAAESTLAREAHAVLLTRSGKEIGVAATKTFTTQLTALALLTLRLSNDDVEPYHEALQSLPLIVEKLLGLDILIQTISKQLMQAQHVLFVGRGNQYPIAAEGALKLKEISYVHAESYPAGELKHGPLALIDENMPVIVLAPSNHLFEKSVSNIQEIRGGDVFVLTDHDAIIDDHVTTIPMPTISDFIAPIAYTIPLQLLAYHIAVLKGTDVDQPRNLAKSVTVE